MMLFLEICMIKFNLNQFERNSLHIEVLNNADAFVREKTAS